MIKNLFKKQLKSKYKEWKTLDRGQALIIGILVTMFVLTIAFSFATLMITELKIQKGVDYSLAANYAAETGIERGIFKLRDNTISYPYHENKNFGGGLSYNMLIRIDPDNNNKRIITSVGEKNKVERKFEVIIRKNPNAEGIYWPLSWKEVNP